MLFRLCNLCYPLNFHTTAVKFCILYAPIENSTLKKILEPLCMKEFIGAVSVFITSKLKTNISINYLDLHEVCNPYNLEII